MDSGMRLRWSDVGKATTPGEYSVGQTVIHVSAVNIETWLDHPSAVFTVVVSHEMDGNRYGLGTYRISSKYD